MGDISDYYRNKELDNMLNPKLPEHSESFIWWKTGNGGRIHIKNMTTTHLRNSINKIKRDKWRECWHEPLMKELKSR